jgi:hypothetical protein
MSIEPEDSLYREVYAKFGRIPKGAIDEGVNIHASGIIL